MEPLCGCKPGSRFSFLNNSNFLSYSGPWIKSRLENWQDQFWICSCWWDWSCRLFYEESNLFCPLYFCSFLSLDWLSLCWLWGVLCWPQHTSCTGELFSVVHLKTDRVGFFPLPNPPLPCSSCPVLQLQPAVKWDSLLHLLFLGQKAQPDSESDHFPCLVLCLWKGGVLGPAAGNACTVTTSEVHWTGGSVSQRGRVERLAGFLFTCCKISQEVSTIVPVFAVNILHILSLNVATCSQRTNNLALQDLPPRRFLDDFTIHSDFIFNLSWPLPWGICFWEEPQQLSHLHFQCMAHGNFSCQTRNTCTCDTAAYSWCFSYHVYWKQ